MARVRFEDVDLLGALSRIVDLHTQHYKEDFDLDKELISKLAVSDRSEDKQLLWMSRPCQSGRNTQKPDHPFYRSRIA